MASEIESGGPAFPTPSGYARVKDHHPGFGEFERTVEISRTGMTFRQWLVGQVAGSLFAEFFRQVVNVPENWRDGLAQDVVRFADALIRAEKGRTP